MAQKRGYVTAAEVNEDFGFSPTDVQICDAEELIDQYVGPQPKFFSRTLVGLNSGNSSTTQITLQSNQRNIYYPDYFKYCFVMIVDGAGAGQTSLVASNTLTGVLTLDTAEPFTVAVDNTSYYRIYQLGKFPRVQDTLFDGFNTPQKYRKWIPDAVRRATMAQIEFMNKMGANFFNTDATSMKSESIGDYAYTRADSSQGKASLIAPKAKTFLKGIMNRKGEMSVSTDPADLPSDPTIPGVYFN
jgi:hypothetical protein